MDQEQELQVEFLYVIVTLNITRFYIIIVMGLNFVSWKLVSTGTVNQSNPFIKDKEICTIIKGWINGDAN